MRLRAHVIGATATAVGIAAAGAGAAALQRRSINRRRPGDDPGFGSLRADPVAVIADDGTPLHVEVNGELDRLLATTGVEDGR